MACNKCGSTSKKCGCKDTPLTTPISFSCPPDTKCPTPETCSEYIDMLCVLTMNFGNYNLNIPAGASLQQVVQTLDIVINDATCADPTSTCQSTLLIYPVAVTSTTITLSWIDSPTAVTYQVEYTLNPLGVWTQLTAQDAADPKQVYITTLTADSTYYLRVNSICGVGNCYSSIITVKTLA